MVQEEMRNMLVTGEDVSHKDDRKWVTASKVESISDAVSHDLSRWQCVKMWTMSSILLLTNTHTATELD